MTKSSSNAPLAPAARFSRRSAARFSMALLLAGSLLGLGTAGALAGAHDAVGSFLTGLTDKAIAQLTDEGVPEDQRKAHFRDLFRAHFDIPTIGRFVIGRYWRSADKQAREDFLAVFEDVMVERFAPQFAGYKDTSLDVRNVSKLKSEDQYLAQSTVRTDKNKTVQVDWRLRKRNDDYQILDIIGEGVSMAQTLRSEYGEVIRQSGGKIEGLTNRLREQLAQSGATSQSAN